MGQKQNNWKEICNYITGKQNNSEIVSNVINERINDKVKSLEDVRVKNKKKWGKRNKFARIFRNGGANSKLDALQTYDFNSKSRVMNESNAGNDTIFSSRNVNVSKLFQQFLSKD